MQMPPYGYATPPAPELSAADQSSLDSLAIFHFVYASLIALGGFIMLAVVLFGIGLVSSATKLRGDGILAGGVFMVVLGCVAGILFLKAFLVFYSGVSLRRAKHKLLSQIVACLCCLNFPMGTALGIFTLVTLGRPSVAARYLFT
ncbi:MAG TPA: hypothetical protein VHM25_01360, partial [Polyangiaceae bacterium]|nr:hypothetical protein [Polyangiaceae bacterium]